MNTTNQNLTPQESLNLITMMISQAKGNVRDNSFYFLFWGWIIVIANLAVFFLLQADSPYAYHVWFIVIPAWVVTVIYTMRKVRKVQRSITHLDRINSSLWIAFGVFASTVPFLGSFINYQINPVILMASGFATVTSGMILRFNPMLAGGIVLFLGGVVSFFVPRDYQELVAAVAVAAGHLVPGYLLKSQKQDV